MARFIIMALPRSRTKWLSEWLSFDGRYNVAHDLAVECSSVQDFEDALDGCDGAVDTGAVLGWRLLRARRPELKIATIHRSLEDIDRSLQVKGWVTSMKDLYLRAEMLSALSQQKGVLSYTYEDLFSESACARLWEHCLGRDFDFEWWDEMRRKKIEIDLNARMARLAANAQALAALRNDILSNEAPPCGMN